MSTSKERGFKILNYNTRLKNFNVARYVYSAVQNDIVTLYNRTYENVFENATGKILKLIENPFFRIPNADVLLLLQMTVKFNAELYRSTTNEEAAVFLGAYDIYLIPAIKLSSSESLLPAFKVDEKLWISEAQLTSSPTYFIEMFHLSLWLMFIVFFLVIGCLSAFAFNRPKIFRTAPTDTFTWFSLITQQGVETRPKFTSHQLVLLSLSILTIIFYGSFEAFMSSYLAMRKPDLPFNDLNGVLMADDYTICIPTTLKHVYEYVEAELIKNDLNLKRLNNEQCPEILQKLNLNYVPDHKTDKNDRRCPSGKTVIVAGNVWGLFDHNESDCRIMLLPGSYFPNYAVMQVSQSFKYQDHLNRGIIRQMSAGLSSYLQKYYYEQTKPDRMQNYIYNEDDVSSISLHQTKLVFGILLCGMALSLLVLVVEKIIAIHLSH